MKKRWVCAVAGVLLTAALVPLSPGRADASFPGALGRIAFASDREGGVYDIFTMNPDGSNPARVTDHPAEDTSPAWDPKARHLVFVSDRAGTKDIYRIDDTGGIVKAITEDGSDNVSPAYDAERDLIVFQTDRDDPDGETNEIYSMEDNGKNLRNLTLHTLDEEFLADNIDPHVGSNGRVVFASDRETDPEEYEIFTMRLDGSDVRRIDPFSREEGDFHSNTQPKWSPDASRIVFVSDIDGESEIYVMNANGSNVRRLTADEDADNRNPAWSPDGARIAWDSDRHGPGSNYEIYVMNPDGSGKTRLTNNGINDIQPAWQSVKDRNAFDADAPGRPVSDGSEMGGGSRIGNPAPAAAPEAAPATESSETPQEAADDPPEVLVVQETVEVRVPEPYPLLEAGAVLTLLIALGLGAVATRRRPS